MKSSSFLKQIIFWPWFSQLEETHHEEEINEPDMHISYSLIDHLAIAYQRW